MDGREGLSGGLPGSAAAAAGGAASAAAASAACAAAACAACAAAASAACGRPASAGGASAWDGGGVRAAAAGERVVIRQRHVCQLDVLGRGEDVGERLGVLVQLAADSAQLAVDLAADRGH